MTIFGALLLVGAIYFLRLVAVQDKKVDMLFRPTARFDRLFFISQSVIIGIIGLFMIIQPI